jgi:hypothetical protein
MATFDFTNVPSQLQAQLDAQSSQAGKVSMEVKLDNPGDFMLVRFLLDAGQSFMGESVHSVQQHFPKTGKDFTHKISCIREDGQEKDSCPLCAAGSPITVSYVMPVYVISKTTNNGTTLEEVNASKYFHRGITFKPMLESVLRQCDGKAPVCTTFRIVRHGKGLDTVYMVEKVSTDDAKISDFPELPPYKESEIIKFLSYSEMIPFIDLYKLQVQKKLAGKDNRATVANNPQYQPQQPYQPYQPQYQSNISYNPNTQQGNFGSSPNIGL